MAKAEGEEPRFFQEAGFLRDRTTEGEYAIDSLVQSNLDVDVLGQAMTTNPNPADDYLAKIRAVCDGSTEDEELYEAIAHFCQQPEKKRPKAFTPLFKKIQGLKGLKRLQNPDAGAEIWIKVCQQIGSEFEPQKRSQSLRSSLVTWINRKLRMQYADADWCRKEQRRLKKETGGRPTESFDAPIDKYDNGNGMTLADLLPSQEPEPMEKAVEEENRENQEQILRKVYEVTDHPPEYPQCTFGEISKRLCEEPKKIWEDIKAEFNIPMKYQLRGWYSRKAKTIFAKIRKSLQEE